MSDHRRASAACRGRGRRSGGGEERRRGVAGVEEEDRVLPRETVGLGGEWDGV